MTTIPAGRGRRHECAVLAGQLADQQCGVVGRAQLRALGITRHDVRNAFVAGRWRPGGPRTVLIDTGSVLTGQARAWHAVLEVGSDAALDGVTALIAAGLRNFRAHALHVSIGPTAARRRVAGVIVHQPRERGAVLRNGLPRTRPEVAAVRAAQWAVSDRQAVLLLAMTVQQRLVDPQRLQASWDRVQRSPRRQLIDQVLRDIINGAQSLGELDFAVLCRTFGLPEPTRQALRRGPRGRVYLDVAWEDIGLAVEIDGAHHDNIEQQVVDALRQNEVVLGGERVLRIPLVALRTRQAEFMEQLLRAHARSRAQAA